MLTLNQFHEGRVQSVGFERNGRRIHVGAMLVGVYRFELRSAERMMVVSGELQARLSLDADFVRYPAGTSFELPAGSACELRADMPSAYVCELL
ncbi:MAG: pyrimidine/purine nucleoside phosphorylase [Polyangiales bacterium]